MSTTESTLVSRSEAHAADIEFFVRRGMTKGYQAMSLVTPPLYTVFILTRRGRGAWHLSRFLRATWIGGAVGESRRSQALIAEFRLMLHDRPGGWGRVRVYQNRAQRRNCGPESQDPCELQRAYAPDPSSFSFVKMTYARSQTASIRADDHATIGGILFAMLTPAFFWKQANVANRERFLI